jgi:hypothetical protein
MVIYIYKLGAEGGLAPSQVMSECAAIASLCYTNDGNLTVEVSEGNIFVASELSELVYRQLHAISCALTPCGYDALAPQTG